LQLNPTMAEAFLQQRRAEMLPALYAVHFENVAAESVGVFEPVLIDEAMARGEQYGLSCPVTPEQSARLKERFGGFVLALGLDRAMALRADSDRTAFVILGRPTKGFAVGTEPVFALCVEVLPQGHSGGDILQAVACYRDRYGGIDAVVADQYQCLDLAPALQASLGIPDEWFRMLHETRQVQTQAFGALAQYFRDGRLVLGVGEAADYWRRELCNLKATLSASLDSATFSGKPFDDTAHAAALAAFALGGVPSYVEPVFHVPDYEAIRREEDRGPSRALDLIRL
jgi:hypothetical protein